MLWKLFKFCLLLPIAAICAGVLLLFVIGIILAILGF